MRRYLAALTALRAVSETALRSVALVAERDSPPQEMEALDRGREFDRPAGAYVSRASAASAEGAEPRVEVAREPSIDGVHVGEDLRCGFPAIWSISTSIRPRAMITASIAICEPLFSNTRRKANECVPSRGSVSCTSETIFDPGAKERGRLGADASEERRLVRAAPPVAFHHCGCLEDVREGVEFLPVVVGVVGLLGPGDDEVGLTGRVEAGTTQRVGSEIGLHRSTCPALGDGVLNDSGRDCLVGFRESVLVVLGERSTHQNERRGGGGGSNEQDSLPVECRQCPRHVFNDRTRPATGQCPKRVIRGHAARRPRSPLRVGRHPSWAGLSGLEPIEQSAALLARIPCNRAGFEARSGPGVGPASVGLPHRAGFEDRLGHRALATPEAGS